MRTLRFAVVVASLAGCLPAAAQEYVRIGNRLFPGQFLHIERGPIQSGAIKPTWWSAQWTVEPLAQTGFVRLRNRWKAEWLQVGRGSRDWAIEPVEGTAYVRLRGRGGEHLHLERGVLQAGAVRADAPSSHWMISSRWPPEATAPAPAAVEKRAVPEERKSAPPPPPAPERWHGPGR